MGLCSACIVGLIVIFWCFVAKCEVLMVWQVYGGCLFPAVVSGCGVLDSHVGVQGNLVESDQ